MTSDGLFVDQLGGDIRIHPLLRLPEAKPDMILEDYSFGDEHFRPGIIQTFDGKVFLTAGKEFSALFEVLGLESIRRITARSVTVTDSMLANKPREIIELAVRPPRKPLRVAMPQVAPVLDGQLDEWKAADWVEIDARRDIVAALALHGDTLYAAYRTRDPKLLNNRAADGWEHVFATGGGLDLMVRTNPSAKLVRAYRRRGSQLELASRGDVRLFITRLGNPERGRVLAVRFQQVGGTGGRALTYTSSVGRVKFDDVKVVSEHVKLAQRDGVYEVAVPLAVMGLKAGLGTATRGDVGVLIGNGSETQARLYWHNKTALMVTDIPTEARLQPQEWGTWHFGPEPQSGE